LEREPIRPHDERHHHHASEIATLDLSRLDAKLIVSCQPVPGGPMDRADIVAAFALAALDGGAAGLRIESAAYVRAVRAVTDAPIIGLVKRDLTDSPVRITPWLEDVTALALAGADIIAFDATDRPRPVPVADLITAIHGAGRIAMADCSAARDAAAALAAGTDIVGSTLSGYTGGAIPDGPDYALIEELRLLSPHVVAEGRIKTPEDAARTLAHGAWCVVVGSAITRTEYVASWFADAMANVPR
jgi:putative N-acetylmannosamine-6-phosphate epimerase